MKYKINLIRNLFSNLVFLLSKSSFVLFCFNSIILSLDNANNFKIVFNAVDINEEYIIF